MTRLGPSLKDGELGCFALSGSCGLASFSSCWHCEENSNGCSGKANGDVAGLGVLLTFVITSTIAILLAWADFLCAPVASHQNSYNGVLDHSSPANIIQRRKRITCPRKAWYEVNQKIVMILSDQMIITGITVLIAGFLPSSHLSIYDFQIVVWLAWLASNCHQVTLTVLQPYLSKHKVVLWFRVLAMAIVWILLSVALVFGGASQGSSSTDQGYSTPYTPDSAVDCAWSGSGLHSWSEDTILSVTLLAINFMARFAKLFTTDSDWTRKWFRRKPGDWLREKYSSNLRKRRSTGNLVPFLIILTYVTSRAISDVLTSRLFELSWLTLSYFYGIIRLFGWRQQAPNNFGESVWGFGQLLAILGLLLPLMAIPGIYAECTRDLAAKVHAPQTAIPAASPHALSLSNLQPSVNSTAPPSKRTRRDQWRSQVLTHPEAFYTSRCIRWLVVVLGVTFLGPILTIITIFAIDVQYTNAKSFTYNLDIGPVVYAGCIAYFVMGAIPFMGIWTVVAYCVGAL